MIPGKLATSKNQAFYSSGGIEYPTNDYKMVRGTILAKGVMPSEADAVGLENNCKLYIGITRVKTCGNNYGPGKVKDD